MSVDKYNITFYNNDSFSENFPYNTTYSTGCRKDEFAVFESVVVVSYLTIMVVSLIGNGMVCYLICCAPKFKSVTNYFIANLSIGDFLMTIFCVPFSFISTLLLRRWPFGDFLCRSVSFFQAASVFVSAYTLVAISLDRYMAIMRPLRPRMTKKHAKIIIGVVWIVAISTALPIAVVSQNERHFYEDCEYFICMEHWTSEQQKQVYSVVLMVLQYKVPLVVLIYTYTRIAIVVWGKTPPGEAENSRDQRLANSKRKMIKMMVIVVVVFTICWLPFNTLMIIHDTGWEEWEYAVYLYFASHWLAMSHTCYNPAIYAYMNSRFRSGFLSVLSKFPCLRNSFEHHRHSRRSTSFAMTALDHDNSLRRVNTCSTYISTRTRKGSPQSTKSSLIKNHAIDCTSDFQ